MRLGFKFTPGQNLIARAFVNDVQVNGNLATMTELAPGKYKVDLGSFIAEDWEGEIRIFNAADNSFVVKFPHLSTFVECVPGATAGVIGPQGPPGIQGSAGVQGPKGDKGDTGNVGANGSQGVQGVPGNTGSTGPAGPSYTHPNHSGDVTSVADGAQTITANAVTNVKAADMIAKTYKGRTTVSTGDPEDVPVSTLKADLVLVKGDVGLGNCDNTSDANKGVSVVQQNALNLKADLAGPTFIGTPAAPTAAPGTNTSQLATTAFVTAADALKANLASPVLTGAPTIAAATGTSLAVTGAVSSSGGGIGYATGAGGVVTQLTSKSTGVALNKLCGLITLNAAALAAGAIVTFTVTNNQMGAADVPVVVHDSGGTVGAYTVTGNGSATGSFKITIRNNTAGSLSEALVLRFTISKAVVA